MDMCKVVVVGKNVINNNWVQSNQNEIYKGS
jgi:hypothetical protein